MTNTKKTQHYFLGAVTADGFSTDFKRTIARNGFFTFILKGGAGTGKSSLMKRIERELQEGDRALYHCSSDPGSLDAVVLEDYKAIVVDGTAPHTFDPEMPAVREQIVNLGEYWDDEKIMSCKDDIEKAMKLNKSYMSRAKRYVRACSDICFDTYSLGLEALDNARLGALADKVIKRILTADSTGSGNISVRQLSAVTMNGFMTFSQTLFDCKNTYIFSDEYYAASSALFDTVAAAAAAKGYDVTLCVYQLLGNDVTEHIIIPELDTALISVNKLNGIERTGRAVNLAKLYDKQLVELKAPRLKLNRSACRTLLDEAARTLVLAKSAHDDIEKNYISAMDFERLDKAGDRLIEKIRKRKG